MQGCCKQDKAPLDTSGCKALANKLPPHALGTGLCGHGDWCKGKVAWHDGMFGKVIACEVAL